MGYAMSTSQSLSLFLDAPTVNGRTDDDKTLVLATRRAGIAEAAPGLPAHDEPTEEPTRAEEEGAMPRS